MYLIHKALGAQAARVEETVRRFEIGSSLQPIRACFNTWAAALAFHAQQEDKYMTAALSDFQPARDNEAEHAALGGILGDLSTLLEKEDTRELSERVKEAMVALNERQHAELVEKLEDVMEVLNSEIGKTKVIARTWRHLYTRVVELRTAQDDHLENEEAFVLPEVWQRISEAGQLEMARRLLIDEEAEDQRWVLKWIAKYLTPAERGLLADLEQSFAQVPAEVS
jgi:hypothetical protein